MFALLRVEVLRRFFVCFLYGSIDYIMCTILCSGEWMKWEVDNSMFCEYLLDIPGRCLAILLIVKSPKRLKKKKGFDFAFHFSCFLLLTAGKNASLGLLFAAQISVYSCCSQNCCNVFVCGEALLSWPGLKLSSKPRNLTR